ncbi:hypothetical protein OIU77_002366 [Salix suchowensis]|uniref:Uncharacterized protein n=1 Tax=Salix suchowensis TaxID=1278906 RepID=A0ABQ9B6R7_9ROSI|nr:hypothetical protein OIU77_002366 [Salix suchowensis]
MLIYYCLKAIEQAGDFSFYTLDVFIPANYGLKANCLVEFSVLFGVEEISSYLVHGSLKNISIIFGTLQFGQGILRCSWNTKCGCCNDWLIDTSSVGEFLIGMTA